ncbi:hypothetical protein CRM22_011314 [Opisthorchis felineus]|uniref:Uncharacterized protein n=1 Tax=Opisthorchis felineus TaxID=147828 RepID=A0A4S2JT28_OPIFE|nr:hypothetical protein CRM22_011314 [Opisthorchis felineus]TGZ37929.1 hypothetical protein CRM22_011314 [Opisthorchis felineus]TGZ37930.1 hypothetical protein CRM22_011314 [Opisthorchis felineus]
MKMCEHWCCYCCEPEEEIMDIEVVEDGDALQEYGVNRTLQLLRSMINQGGRPIIDQPPPAYKDFAKYPLATEMEDKPSMMPTTRSAWYPTITHVQQSANSSDSRPSTWMEPFPKPPGEPPPVPQNWFFTRLASIRRSLMAHFSPSRRASTVLRDTTTTESVSNLPENTAVSRERTEQSQQRGIWESTMTAAQTNAPYSSPTGAPNHPSSPVRPTNDRNMPFVRTVRLPRQSHPTPSRVNLSHSRSYEDIGSVREPIEGADRQTMSP